jgi:hypothetical protein
MSLASNGRPVHVPDPVKADPAPESSREAKRRAAAMLDVLAGLRTPAQAATLINVSLPRYYQLETRAVAALAQACEPQPHGRRRGPAQELAALAKENERLRHELGRQQSLVRLAQRSVGLNPPTAPPKGRRRRKTARALVAAARLREAADAADGCQVINME